MARDGFGGVLCDLARWQDFRDVVIDNENHHHDQEDEPDLEYRLFDLEAQVAAYEHLNQQQHNAAAIQDGDRQQVENGQVQADHGHQQEERRGTFARGFPGKLRDANGPLQRLRRHAPLNNAAQELEDQ